MAGSALAPILIPIAAMAGLAFWIFMIFYADSHPAHGSGTGSLGSGDYDTGLQGPYLTKPELRLPAQRRAEEHQTERQAADRGQGRDARNNAGRQGTGVPG